MMIMRTYQRFNKKTLLCSAIAFCVFNSGCANLPNVNPNDIVSESLLPSGAAEWSENVDSDKSYANLWSGLLQEPQLLVLIEEGLSASPTLASREAAVRAADLRVRAVKGERMPTLSAQLSATALRNVNRSSLDSETSSFGVLASWEPDIWGRLKSSERQAAYTLLSEDAKFQAAALSLSGRIAFKWVSIKSARTLLSIAEEDLEARNEIATLTSELFEQGLITALDVRTSETLFRLSESQLATRRLAVAQLTRELEVLLGRFPNGQLNLTDGLTELPKLSIDKSPLELMAARPDLAILENEIVALGFGAKAVKLSLAPRLLLSSSILNNKDGLAGILDFETLVLEMVSNLTTPIFEGRRLRSEYKARLADIDVVVGEYVNAVLEAWFEVETAIVADQFLSDQIRKLSEAIQAAEKAEELARAQYIAGTAGIFQLIDTQTLKLEARNSLANTREAFFLNRIRLHVALGEGLGEGAPLNTGATSELN